jgi:hypothetical protein
VGSNLGKLSPARRRQARSKMVLGVRVFIADENGKFTEQLVHTLDIAPDGARVGGLHQPPQVGQIVAVQRRAVKRSFKVMWVVQTGREYQLGLEASDSVREHWALELPTARDEYRPR